MPALGLEQTILAYKVVDAAVLCGGACETATASATCVFGNDGGGWIDCLKGQESTEDNLHRNSRFCDFGGRDLTLRENSPCLAENSDAEMLIGYYEQGCGSCDTAVESTTWGAIKGLYR